MRLKKIKILYLLDRYNNPYGGAEGHLTALMSQGERVFDIELALIRPVDSLSRVDIPSGARLLNIQHTFSVFSLVKLVRLSAMVKRKDIELVHIFLDDVSIWEALILRVLGCKVVVSTRRVGRWHEELLLKLFSISHYMIDEPVIKSRSTTKHGAERASSQNRVTVVYNGYTAGHLVEHVRDDSGLERKIRVENAIVGVVVDIAHRDRLGDVLSAFNLVKKEYRNAILVVVGLESDRKNYHPRADFIKDDAVFFVESKTQIEPILRLVDVAIISSCSEYFSDYIVSGMRSDRSVICRDGGALPAFISEDISNLDRRKHDVLMFSKRIRWLLRFPQLAGKAGRSYLHEVGNHHSHIERLVNDHQAMYQKVVYGFK